MGKTIEWKHLVPSCRVLLLLFTGLGVAKTKKEREDLKMSLAGCGETLIASCIL